MPTPAQIAKSAITGNPADATKKPEPQGLVDAFVAGDLVDAAEAEARAAADTALDVRLTANEALALQGVKPAKQSVRLLATANINLATAAENGDTFDGVVLATGNRIALTGQTAPAENGVYIVQASGAAVRATDMDASSELLGATFSVDAGTHAGEVWGLTNTAAITVGSTAITIVKQGAANAVSAEVIAGRAGEADLKTRDDVRQAKRGTNVVRYPRLDGGPYNLKFINSTGTIHPAAVETTIESFLNRDLNYEVQFPVTGAGLFQYIPEAAEKARLLGSYVCDWFVGHTEDVAPSGAVTRLVGGSDGGSTGILILIGGGTTGRVQIDANTWFFYNFGQMPSAGTTYLATADDLLEVRWGFTSNPSATTFSVSEHGLAFRDTPWVVGDIPALVKSLRDKRLEEPSPTLTLDGLGNGSIEVARGDVVVRRSFGGVGPQTIIPVGGKANFSQTEDKIGGVVLRDMTDDEAPALLASPVGHFGGQHQYTAGLCTAAAHGLTSAAIGQVRSKSGVNGVVLDVPTTGTLVLAVDGSEVLPTDGTWTYVTGPGETGSVDVSAVSSTPRGWGPMAANREQFAVVDNRRLPMTGVTGGVKLFNINAGISESYDILPRQTVLDHIKAHGSDLSGLTGAPIFSYSNTYIYDQDGNLTIPMSFVARQTLTPSRFYGAQVQLSGGGAHHWFIPGALPFTQDAVDYDFAMIQPAIAPTNEILLGSSRSENDVDDPLFLDRFVIMSDTHYLAVVLLPIQAADPAVRRSVNVPGTNTAISIASTGKAYMSAFNDTDASKSAGFTKSWSVGRNLGVRSADRTCFDIYRHPEADFIYLDWHDKAGVDKVNLPFDLCGREFSVVAKRNAELLNDELNGFLLPEVDASGDYARLVLRVEH